MARFDTTADVAKFIADFGLSYYPANIVYSSNHTAHYCTLTYNDKSIPVTYNGTSAPTVMDVVHVVVQDAYSYDTTRHSIDTFASEYGYKTADTPISKILDAFNKCKESYEWLCDDYGYGKPLYSYELPQLVKMIDDHQNEIADKVNFIVKEKEASYAYSNPPVPEGFVSLKEVMNSFDLGEYGQRITEYDGSEYIADIFSSIADEGLLEGVNDGDIIKMTQIAQYVCYERDLYDHKESIASYFAAHDLYDKGVYIVSKDIADTLSICGEYCDCLDLATDYLQEEIKNSLIAHFEEMYGEENEFIYEMADKVIDSNFTMVNPCVMHVATANIVNEKGYEQAFDNQWKDYLRQSHIDNLSTIHGQDLTNFFNFNDWETLPTIDTFQEWYTNDFSQINETSFADNPDGLTNAQNAALTRLDNLLFNPENRWSSTLSTHDTDKETITVSSISKAMSASSKEIKEHNTPDTNRSDHPER